MKSRNSFFVRTQTLLAIAVGSLLFISVLYIENIPQRIDHGNAAQAAIAQLDAVRGPILRIKALENNLLTNPDTNSDLSQFKSINAEAENIIDVYLEMARYNTTLYALVKEFSNRYAGWCKQEKRLLTHIDLLETDVHYEISQVVETDRQLLSALAILAKGEKPLHSDIHDGQLAVRIAQISGVLLIVYLFLVVIISQRISNLRISAREQDLDTTLHSIGDAVISTDNKGLITRMNPVAEQLTGWHLKHALGKSLTDVFVIKNASTGKTVRNPVDSVLENGQIVGLANHTVLISKEGMRYQIADSAAPIKNQAGIIHGVVLVFHDVTTSYEIQQVVKEQADRLSNVIESSMDVIIAADEEGRIIEWNKQAENTFGWSQNEIIGAYLHETIIPVRYRDNHLAGIKKLKKFGESKIIGNRIEISATHKDGREFPIELSVSQLDTKEGYLFSAFIRDLTEIKKSEKELELAAITFESHSGIVITDDKKRILRVNPAMEAMSGYRAEEMIGEYPSMLKSGKQSGDFYKQMWQQINTVGNWSGELWNKRKDGVLYAEYLTITAVKNKADQVTNYVGTSNNITERKNAETKIVQLAYYDELTDLANRRLLLDRLKHEITVASRHNTYGALLFLDLDRFKNLNDALGHPVGDELLRQVAKRLKALVRSEDTVSRLGGDEFVIMLPASNHDFSRISIETSNVADKVKQSLNEVFDLDGYLYYLNTSIGMVVFPEAGEDADDILKHADSALYLAKSEGRNTSRFYKPEMQVDADARLQLEKDIRQALQNDELVLNYQPKVDVDGNITGAEALIRWHHPIRGLVSPDEFIPVAEETGLILDIGRWVLQQAMQQVKKWHELGICPNSKSLAVNVSPRQFHQADFVDEMLEMINAAGILPGCIELEITENLLMEGLGDVIKKLTRLRKMGIKISIDDFGTGYSSLSYLKRLPLDKLKIDQSFVRDINTDSNDAAIVDTIIAMSKHLDLDVIAEGVETQEQLDFLIGKGCKIFQGYYFSKAVSEERMMMFLKTNSIVVD